MKTDSPKAVVVDGRMLRHSGIGTSIRGLLAGWRAAAPPFAVVLAADPQVVAETDDMDGVDIRPWKSPVYGARAALSRPPVEQGEVFLATHYSAPLFPGVPMVAVVHDVIHITHPTRRGTAAYMRAYLWMLRRRVRFVVSPSRHTKVQLQTLHGFPAERVLRIPWGPGIAGLAEREEPRPNMLPDSPYFIAVGINKPHKNWRFLFRELVSRWEADPAFPALVVAGFGRPDHVTTPARKWMQAGKLVFLPPLHDGELLGVFQRSRGLLFPSLVEGFGFPVAEAQALGRPVLIADLPPMNEIAGNGAFRFQPDEPESFHRALDSMLSSNTPIPQTSLDWTRCAQQYTEVIQRAFAE